MSRVNYAGCKVRIIDSGDRGGFEEDLNRVLELFDTLCYVVYDIQFSHSMTTYSAMILYST